MSLAAGTRPGPYEILAPLGAGGMGEVHRARDTRLRRDVAIKVLPQAIASGGAWERFEREARAASALNHGVLKQQPSNNDARLWRAILHLLAGQNTVAQEDLRIILDREPLNGPARMFLGETIRMERDLPGAVQQQQQVLEQAPKNMSARNLALADMDGGELDKARGLLEEKRSMFPNNYMWRATWALLLALEGKRQEALQTMDNETLKFLGASVVTTLGAAEFYAVLENTPKALEWLEKVVRNGDERVEWFRKDPLLANIREDPRFRQIVDLIETRRKSQRVKR